MRLFSKPKFIIDLEMLHLATELAAARAAKAEMERQFHEQYPNLAINIKDYSVDFSNIQNLEINIPNFDVEYK